MSYGFKEKKEIEKMREREKIENSARASLASYGGSAYERMKNFLFSYRKCYAFCISYEEELGCGLVSAEDERLREGVYRSCRERCEEVRRFMCSLGLEPDEKSVMFFHYIEGLSLDVVAEKIYVSRSTLYRIHKRAEYKALEGFLKMQNSR